MAKYVWYNGKVVDIIDETHNIKRFFIEIPEVDNFEFIAGQFVILDLPIASKFTTRMYSVASAPSSGKVIELIIVVNEDGLGTPYLFNKIKVGDTLRTSSALGKFVLPETLDRDLCLVCTGVGIAPFRSMCLDIYNNNIPHKNIYLAFGTRYITDMCYPEELYKLDKEEDSFHFIPTLSREKSDQWTGRKGYVHPIYEHLFQDARPAYFYLCGWKTTIFDARDAIQEMGYERNDIKYELYD